MEKKKFEVVLILLVPQIIQLIVENLSCDEITASKEFYSSEVYSLLEQEDTKIWHFSPLTLFNMYQEEKSTGSISFPEVSALFTRYEIWDYIYSCFESLHTTGENYIIGDIDLYIEERFKKYPSENCLGQQ